MTRRTTLVALIIALGLCPGSLLAQRGGGRGGRGGSSGGASGVPADSEEMKDFKRGAAVQANERQIALFQELAKDAEMAKSQAAEFARQGKMTPDQLNTLDGVIGTARDESNHFLASLSDVQRAGLKASRKNVEKADSDLGKRWEALNQQLERTKPNDQQIAAEMEKLEKALARFVTEQWALGNQMGIQLPPNPGGHAADQ